MQGLYIEGLDRSTALVENILFALGMINSDNYGQPHYFVENILFTLSLINSDNHGILPGTMHVQYIYKLPCLTSNF